MMNLNAVICSAQFLIRSKSVCSFATFAPVIDALAAASITVDPGGITCARTDDGVPEAITQTHANKRTLNIVFLKISSENFCRTPAIRLFPFMPRLY